MAIPRTFTVLGEKWRTKLVKNLKTEDGAAFGVNHADKKLVEIERSLSMLERESVFWHEYCHIFLRRVGLSGNDGGVDGIAEEMICDRFSEMASEIEIIFKKMRTKTKRKAKPKKRTK